MSGRLPDEFRWPGIAPIPPGPVELIVGFVGGPAPSVAEIRLTAGAAPIDLAPLAHPLHAVGPLIDLLHDPKVRVEAQPGGTLWVRIAPGLSATIPGEGAVTLEAEAVGPPDRPRLNKPLIASIGGTGLSIRLPGSRWLRILASVAIRRASLSPDGAVELHGTAPGSLDRAVGVGLRHASHHLSDLVRKHPQFARVRTFLDS
ncbi:MAG: hypothetical protein ABMB14_24065 [Myxococcota bacterium]